MSSEIYSKTMHFLRRFVEVSACFLIYNLEAFLEWKFRGFMTRASISNSTFFFSICVFAASKLDSFNYRMETIFTFCHGWRHFKLYHLIRTTCNQWFFIQFIFKLQFSQDCSLLTIQDSNLRFSNLTVQL